jgi:hypothetical protein
LQQGNPEAGDRFGAALTAGLLDPAANWDLAVGAPGENVSATADAGAVSVFYSTTGILPTTSQTLLQGNPEAGDRFGAALTAGFLDPAANWDLAVGAPGENVSATIDAGAVSVFYSTASPGGLPTTSQTLLQGNPEAGDRFGSALTAAPFNSASPYELAVGAPGEDVGATADAGAVSIFYGSKGILPTTSQGLLQGFPEAGDRFGSALTAGFFNSASPYDLAVGAPGENVGGTIDAGAANVFYSTTGGLPTTSRVLLQGNPEAGDRFGGALDI